MSNLLSEWSRLLSASFAQAGVQHVVTSPGSRSTPFVWALLQQGLTCHSLWDERSAGFFALGQARVTGKPSLLVCTSGSAAANYFPAVVEAAMSHLPLLVLSADRPFELQEAAAPQSMDQLKLYGDYCRSYFELGSPEQSATSLRALRRIIGQAVHLSQGPRPGPIHINPLISNSFALISNSL